MLVIYRVSGLAANIALIIYVGIVLALLSLFRITLTLPGIAGIILSIGMAVDANVIIFERLREEIKSRRTMRANVEASFRRAFPAILDSNVTTLIAAAVLFWLGTGPIKGFAQTLAIGIAVSMFTALTCTRFILLNLVGAGLNKESMFVPIAKEANQA
jgi:preprotein translocase subunit SecD